MVKTKDCEYVFNWKTPSGCAVVNSTVEKCAVYDKQYGFYFDLNALKHDVHSQNLGKGIKYEAGFCGSKVPSCGKDYDSCLVGGKSDSNVRDVFTTAVNVLGVSHAKVTLRQ